MADVKVALLFCSIVFATVAIACIFGIGGLYAALGLHTLVSAFAITFAAIAIGELK